MQLYAKNHNDAKLMVEIMKLLKRNDLPLQPGTADIVLRYVGYNLQLLPAFALLSRKLQMLHFLGNFSILNLSDFNFELQMIGTGSQKEILHQI